jgi:hypothetical protein
MYNSNKRIIFCFFIIFLANSIFAAEITELANGENREIIDAPKNNSNKPYFYKGYDYGSQSLFNPLYLLLNRGYDVLQCRVNSRNIFKLEYEQNANNIFSNLRHSNDNISEYGWKKFLTREVFPLNYSSDEARWIPNFSLHLIGGGMTYTELKEWAVYYSLPLPNLISAGTIILAALLNETLENKGSKGRNTDAIADFYFFDLGGILLFSFDAVNKFFSTTLEMSDWSLQPSFTFPSGSLHNHGQYYSIKWAIPSGSILKFFCYFGLATLGGFSYRFSGDKSISIGLGGKTSRLLRFQSNPYDNKLEIALSGGIFFDINNSLMTSLIISDVEDYFCNLNIYPGLLRIGSFSSGFWAVLNKKGEFIFGLTVLYQLGVGIGYGRS